MLPVTRLVRWEGKHTRLIIKPVVTDDGEQVECTL